MGSIRGVLFLTVCAIVLFQCVSARKHHGHKREIEVKRATFNVTLDGTDSTETTADILTRLKLLAYAEKLKAKQAKKKAKADKKAQKEKAWNAYLMSLVPPAPGADGSTAGTGTGVAGTAAMAQAQAAAAAAAAEATTTAGPGIETPGESDEEEE